jgi:pilus assembly protein Flp/PilA
VSFRGLSGSPRSFLAVREKGGDTVNIRSKVTRLRALLRNDEDGQGLAEYALILALIAIVSIVALIFMGSQVSTKLSIVGSQLQSVSG